VAFVSAIFAWSGAALLLGSGLVYVVGLALPGSHWANQFLFASSVLNNTFLASSFAGGVAFGARHISEKVGQKSYDIKSRSLYNEVIAGIHEVFFVFLRPFYTTNKIVVNDDLGILSQFKLRNYTGGNTFRLEIQLVKAFQSIGPVVGLGRPGEAVGVGRILTTEEGWKAAASKLIEQALCVICVPSSKSGTLWELEQIFERGFEGKTVFVMPPFPHPLRNEPLFHIEQDWDELVIKMKKFDVNFPNYRSEGALFYINSDNAPVFQDLNLHSPQLIRNAIQELLKLPPLFAGS
jgi:hypothetical protein